MQSPWLTRRFPEGLPFEALPAHVDRLRAFPERAEQLLATIPPELRTLSDGRSWSLQREVGHLLDLEALGLRRLAELKSGAAELSPADMQNRRTYEARHDDVALEELLSAWRAERDQLVRELSELNAAAATRTALHPRLRQPMHAVDLAHFIAEHDEHHLARIEERLVRDHPELVHVADAREADLGAITAIFNAIIATSTAIYREEPFALEERRAWWQERVQRRYPVLVARRGAEVLGFSTFGDFRAAPGYRFTVEHSVHVAPGQRGAGIGERLVRALFPRAKLLGKHMMIAGTDSANAGSIRFHERLGFTRCAHLREVGFKHGRRLDLVFLQRAL
ncbi:MAG: GNAT family N-acetyltransferase [Planctomycetes bacterium]|nr:GNAT family N-acetyltransferase [Planctomycetota bacterium]